MKKWFKNNKWSLIGIVLGAIAGYLYWLQVGCVSGTCAITSKPINSTVYGALMGYLVSGFFKKENRKQSVNNENEQSL
jgi:hypothetical protein